MSGSSSLPGSSVEHNVVGPDYFGFYTQELIELLSEDDDSLRFLPQRPTFSSSVVLGVDLNNSLTINDNLVKDFGLIRWSENLFSGPIGSNLDDCKKERLRSLLRESFFTFAHEVDEMLHSILSVSRMRAQLEDKKKTLKFQSTENIPGHDHHPQKKQKVSPSTSDLEEKPIDVVFSGEEMMDSCSGKCELRFKSSSTLSGAVPEAKVNDLQFLINKDCTVVEKYVKICSDELFDTIAAMEQKLEEFIDIVISTFRPMTHLEKHKLRKFIQDLPAGNLDRVAEIITRHKPLDKYPCDEIHVDLENENKVTLWRLYYYVAAVENARKLCEA